ncbi:hypothetical protein WDW86_21835 [Bdellovibrionota bacterium FG-2]
MKTSVELDDQKVSLAKKLGGEPVLRKLLDHALDAYIADRRRNDMVSILGTGFFEGRLKRGRNLEAGTRGRSRR